jgi:NADPH:quinone reductase-like Zn-dependent oxidoreductase
MEPAIGGAQVLKAFGGPENFKLAEIPRPEIRPDMVLVRLRYFG